MLEHLIVCRHGETQWNIERRAQGRADSPLTAAGIEQAQALGRARCGLCQRMRRKHGEKRAERQLKPSPNTPHEHVLTAARGAALWLTDVKRGWLTRR